MSFRRVVDIQTVAFLVIVFASFVCVVAHFTTGAGRDPFSGMGWSQIADGEFTAKAADGVVAALPKSDALNGFQAGIEYRVFDDAGPQVRAGCSGWLFLGEEVWEVKDGDRNIALRLAIAKAMASTFARRGVRLVMLTVPDKARVAASELCRQRVSPQSAARLALWSRLVRDVPMPKVNIVDGWPFKPGYWRTDTHWDREGARFAAERTAAVVEALLGGRGAEQATVTQATQEERRPGDLMHVSNLENAPRWLQPPPDMERPVSVNWKHIGSLLDAGPASDVVLVGSSYSKNSGFLDALGLALGREIVQLSEEGGGFDGALFDLLHRHRNTLANAKVVIWEFPERSLTQALTPDEHAFLHR